MKVVKPKLGKGICDNIFFLLAILGCDTTSHLYGIGKGTPIKKYDFYQHFREQAKLFHSSLTVDEVVAAGDNALVSLYNGKQGDRLDSLRYRRYYEKLASKKSHIQPHNLPPTSVAAKYHSIRVYLQVQLWKG